MCVCVCVRVLVCVLVCVVCQLDDGEGVRRRPPAKLKSLKAKKEQSVPNLEEIEEKIRLAEERRKVQCVCVCLCMCVSVFLCHYVP